MNALARRRHKCRLTRGRSPALGGCRERRLVHHVLPFILVIPRRPLGMPRRHVLAGIELRLILRLCRRRRRARKERPEGRLTKARQRRAVRPTARHSTEKGKKSKQGCHTSRFAPKSNVAPPLRHFHIDIEGIAHGIGRVLWAFQGRNGHVNDGVLSWRSVYISWSSPLLIVVR